eukprot:snap_masked-scaffold_1-processed-gene-25.25-mRNA-1 protein AED:1.00 eAED:1.00 QI:0/-1/0/0/-1/1/1/0/935
MEITVTEAMSKKEDLHTLVKSWNNLRNKIWRISVMEGIVPSIIISFSFEFDVTFDVQKQMSLLKKVFKSFVPYSPLSIEIDILNSAMGLILFEILDHLLKLLQEKNTEFDETIKELLCLKQVQDIYLIALEHQPFKVSQFALDWLNLKPRQLISYCVKFKPKNKVVDGEGVGIISKLIQEQKQNCFRRLKTRSIAILSNALRLQNELTSPSIADVKQALQTNEGHTELTECVCNFSENLLCSCESLFQLVAQVIAETHSSLCKLKSFEQWFQKSPPVIENEGFSLRKQKKTLGCFPWVRSMASRKMPSFLVSISPREFVNLCIHCALTQSRQDSKKKDVKMVSKLSFLEVQSLNESFTKQKEEKLKIEFKAKRKRPNFFYDKKTPRNNENMTLSNQIIPKNLLLSRSESSRTVDMFKSLSEANHVSSASSVSPLMSIDAHCLDASLRYPGVSSSSYESPRTCPDKRQKQKITNTRSNPFAGHLGLHSGLNASMISRLQKLVLKQNRCTNLLNVRSANLKDNPCINTRKAPKNLSVGVSIRYLQLNQNLVWLNLQQNNLDLRALRVFFASKFPSLEHLDLSRNRIGLSEANFFYKNFPSLSRIKLRSNLIQSANKLSGFRSLTLIDLRCNSISAPRQLRLLSLLVNLQCLRLEKNPILSKHGNDIQLEIRNIIPNLIVHRKTRASSAVSKRVSIIGSCASKPISINFDKPLYQRKKDQFFQIQEPKGTLIRPISEKSHLLSGVAKYMQYRKNIEEPRPVSNAQFFLSEQNLQRISRPTFSSAQRHRKTRAFAPKREECQDVKGKFKFSQVLIYKWKEKIRLLLSYYKRATNMLIQLKKNKSDRSSITVTLTPRESFMLHDALSQTWKPPSIAGFRSTALTKSTVSAETRIYLKLSYLRSIFKNLEVLSGVLDVSDATLEKICKAIDNIDLLLCTVP